MSKQQREYLLREQLKTINKELGIEKDDKEDMLKKYRERVEGFEKSIPADTLTVINDEINKMASLERNSPEFNVTRSYLDWLTQMPWGKKTVDELDLHKASEVLNVDHYGLGESFPLPPFPFLLRPRSLV
jgi:ATP-dependent Lon protease